MSVNKVDIRILYDLYIENLKDLDKGIKSRMFEGSDLVYNPENDNLRSVASPESPPSTIEKEAKGVDLFRRLDTNQDAFLTLDEARAALQKFGINNVSPEKWLEGAQLLVEKRYSPISKNMKKLKGELSYEPIINLLQTYNYGIYLEDIRRANSELGIGTGLGKPVTNIIFIGPAWLHNRFVSEKDEAPLLMGDALAKNAGEKRYMRAQKALSNLEQVFKAGLEANEEWAMNGDLNEALARLEPADAKIISNQIAGKELFKIFTIEDDRERYNTLLAFIQNERPGLGGFLGFGCGNANESSFWNWAGCKSNQYFLQSAHHFLVSKASTGNPEEDELRQQFSRDQLEDIGGDGGGYGNLFLVTVTNFLSLRGTFFEPTPYRDWSDADTMNGFGRGLGTALAFGGGREVVHSWKAIWKLRRYEGFKGVARSIAGNGTPFWVEGQGSLWNRFKGKAARFNPLPTRKLKADAFAAQKADELAKMEGTAQTKKLGPVRRRIAAAKSWLGNKIFKPIPGIEKVAKLKPKKGGFMNKLVDGLFMYMIADYADTSLNAEYDLNPFEANREFDADPWPDPTKCDPALYIEGCPQPKNE